MAISRTRLISSQLTQINSSSIELSQLLTIHCSESESHCDWRQSVCLFWCRAPSGAHDQILITVWQLLSCPWEGAFSDERTVLSFVSQPAVLGQLSVCTIFAFYMCHMLLSIYTIYTRPLSVRAQYSRLCPISPLKFPLCSLGADLTENTAFYCPYCFTRV
jgi:hypothetical protein